MRVEGLVRAQEETLLHSGALQAERQEDRLGLQKGEEVGGVLGLTRFRKRGRRCARQGALRHDGPSVPSAGVLLRGPGEGPLGPYLRYRSRTSSRHRLALFSATTERFPRRFRMTGTELAVDLSGTPQPKRGPSLREPLRNCTLHRPAVIKAVKFTLVMCAAHNRLIFKSIAVKNYSHAAVRKTTSRSFFTADQYFTKLHRKVFFTSLNGDVGHCSLQSTAGGHPESEWLGSDDSVCSFADSERAWVNKRRRF